MPRATPPSAGLSHEPDPGAGSRPVVDPPPHDAALAGELRRHVAAGRVEAVETWYREEWRVPGSEDHRTDPALAAVLLDAATMTRARGPMVEALLARWVDLNSQLDAPWTVAGVAAAVVGRLVAAGAGEDLALLLHSATPGVRLVVLQAFPRLPKRVWQRRLQQEHDPECQTWLLAQPGVELQEVDAVLDAVEQARRAATRAPGLAGGGTVQMLRSRPHGQLPGGGATGERVALRALVLRPGVTAAQRVRAAALLTPREVAALAGGVGFPTTALDQLLDADAEAGISRLLRAALLRQWCLRSPGHPRLLERLAQLVQEYPDVSEAVLAALGDRLPLAPRDEVRALTAHALTHGSRALRLLAVQWLGRVAVDPSPRDPGQQAPAAPGLGRGPEPATAQPAAPASRRGRPHG